MKSLIKLMGIIALFGILVACTDTNNHEDDPEVNQENENNMFDEETENNENSLDEKTESNGNNEDENTESNETKGSNNSENKEQETNETSENDEVVLENDAFQIFEPDPNEEVVDRIVVRGLAKVFEGTVQYSFEDGHFIIDKGFTTASATEWGEFEIVIELEDIPEGLYRVVLFEESAKDGSIVHELLIPVEVVE